MLRTLRRFSLVALLLAAGAGVSFASTMATATYTAVQSMQGVYA